MPPALFVAVGFEPLTHSRFFPASDELQRPRGIPAAPGAAVITLPRPPWMFANPTAVLVNADQANNSAPAGVNFA
jgi:hypothetical protein